MSVPATAAPDSGDRAQDPGQAGAIPAQEQRAGPTPASGAETQEQTTRTPDYVRDAFMRLRGYTQSAAPAPQVQNVATETVSQAPPASSGPAQETERRADAPGPGTTLPPRQRGQRQPQRGTPGTATGSPNVDTGSVYTQEQLQRLVQAEADRVLAKRLADERVKAERDREVELRRTDPFEYARLMEERETQLAESQKETERLTGVIATQLQFYDRGVLDPFVGALPEPLREKVISKTEGIEGRKETAVATVKALRAHYLAEGRASARSELMRDSTFIKEILARYGSAPPSTEQTAPVPVRATPERNGSYADSQDNEAVNNWMRSASRGIRSMASR